MDRKKITIAGLGYVGMSMTSLLCRHHHITAFDIDKNKINDLKNKKSPIDDEDINQEINKKDSNILATNDKKLAFRNAEYVIVCTPTDYDTERNYFNTDSIESVIRDALAFNKKMSIIIKSTIPIGFTSSMKDKFQHKKIFFSPEFLREGRALQDNLNPSRIILSPKKKESIEFSEILLDAATKKDVPILFMDTNEAESVKLISNTYLAMRVAFFNEIDNFCIAKNLNARDIIDGVSHDPRIGSNYNNPSFGYGGYCLPKDTKQMLANFSGIPNSLIKAIVDSNSKRFEFLSEIISNTKPKKIGIYLLAMKQGSDNHRSSAVINLIRKLEACHSIIIYEPSVSDSFFDKHKVINDLEKFKNMSDLVIANRLDKNLDDISKKVFSRDLYGND